MASLHWTHIPWNTRNCCLIVAESWAVFLQGFARVMRGYLADSILEKGHDHWRDQKPPGESEAFLPLQWLQGPFTNFSKGFQTSSTFRLKVTCWHPLHSLWVMFHRKVHSLLQVHLERGLKGYFSGTLCVYMMTFMILVFRRVLCVYV